MAPQPDSGRELIAWIWYPATRPEHAQAVDDYLPTAWRAAIDQHSVPIFRLFVTRDLSRVHAHSYQDAAVSSAQPSYPVVFMRAGAAAQTTQYTCLAEDLASHGYVVVGFDAPYRSTITVFPDGRVIARAAKNNVELAGGPQQVQLATKLAQTWSSDMSYVLDRLKQLNDSDPAHRFTGRLDLEKIGAFGHSLGGATVLQFCHDDSRCKAGIDVDGLPLGDIAREGVSKPFMFVLSDHSKEPQTETRPVMTNIHSIYDRLPGDQRLWISIQGADHFRFGDGAMLQLPLAVGALHRLGVVHLDGRRQVEITEHFISTFFDVYLKGAPVSTLTNASAYPEVEYIH
jgi:predicted dienelactone hydrolase